MAAAVFVAEHIFVFAAIAATFYVAGRRALRSVKFANAAEEFAFSVAVGIGLCGTALFCLALAGHFVRAAVLGLLILIHIAGIPVWNDLARRIRGFQPRKSRFAIALAAFCVPCFRLGLLPPHAFDETMYHLPFAKAFALGHSVEFLWNLRNPVYPQLVESIFGALLLCADDVSCHFIELIAMAAVAAALFGVASRFGSRKAGLLAAGAWLGSPLVVHMADNAMIDLTLTLFVSLGIFSWEIHRATDDRRYLALAGALAGFAAATKYLGLPVLALVPLLIAVSGTRGRKLSDSVVFIAAGAAGAFPFYLWIIASTGNPVFPYLAGIFGGNSWVKSDFFEAGHAWSAGIRLFWQPWRALLQGSSMFFKAPLSPALLPLFPFALLAAIKWPRHRAGVSLALVATIVAGSVDARFLLPTLPLFCVAAADGLGFAFLSGRPVVIPARISALLTMIALVLAAPGVLSTVRRLRWEEPICADPAERSAYLRSRLPAYGAVEWLNFHAGHRYTVFGLYTENMSYFADGLIVGDWYGPANFDLIARSAGKPLRLARVLRAWGADFFLYDGARARTGLFRDSDLPPALFERVYQDGKVRLWRVLAAPKAAGRT